MQTCLYGLVSTRTAHGSCATRRPRSNLSGHVCSGWSSSMPFLCCVWDHPGAGRLFGQRPHVGVRLVSAPGLATFRFVAKQPDGAAGQSM